MALLSECPKCNTRNSTKNKLCSKCGYNIIKVPHKTYWIDYRVNGKRKRERIGPSKVAAENRLRKVQTNIVEEREIDKNKNVKVTLGQLKEWYLELPEVKELDSYQGKKAQLSNILRILGSNRTVSQIDIECVNEYRSLRSQEPSARRKNQLTTPATINREVAALKHLLNRALFYGKIESNPVAKIAMLKEDNVRERVLSDVEFECLLDCSPIHLKPVLITAFYEPMRKDEIIKLVWSEVDLKGNPGFIRLAAKRTKGKKSGRAIPLHPRVRETLLHLPSRFKGGRVFLKNGKPFNSFTDAFTTAKKKAGIKDFVFHDFRHCAITNLRKAGNDYSTIMKASGHKTMSMFFRYNLVDEEDVAGMKWKGEEKSNPQEIEDRLIAAGFDPEEVKKMLNQQNGNSGSKMG